MSKTKRVTLVEKDTKQAAKVYPNVIKKRGRKVLVFIVRGWKKDGKWQRKQFVNEADADAYAATVNVNLHNEGESRQLVLTSLTETQVREAEDTFRQLGNTYTMPEVTEFFLKHNRAPGFRIDILDAMEIWLNEKAPTVRNQSMKRPKGVLGAFAKFTGNPDVHTVTKESVKAYMKSLRAKDKVSPAKRKTWNHHRDALSEFFAWASLKDLTTNRPWTFNNPAKDIVRYKLKQIAEQRPDITITSVDTVRELMSYAMNYKGGKMVKFFALIYFAGIRPDPSGEIGKMKTVDLTSGKIPIKPVEAKTSSARTVTIMDSLKPWLEMYEDMPIIPLNCKNDAAHIRKKFGLGQDETRHSYISYHVALYGSLAQTALQAGNSETMIKEHYLMFPTHEEGRQFFSIVPDKAKGEAVFIEQEFESRPSLRAI